MGKEQLMNRVSTPTGTLLIRVVNDADGTPDSANMTAADLASVIASAAGDVTSVNGLTGAVVLDAADIAFTPEGTVAATTVQAAIVEAASEGGSGDGVPLPAVEGTDGQVLVIATTDPSLETAWADASEAVDAAIAAHDAETAVHGITDTTALLDTSDISTNVQPYHSGVPTTMYYTEATAATAVRPTWDGPVIWFNTDGQTDPTNAVGGATPDPIIKPVGA